MSARASLIYILIGAILAGYVAGHWALARDLDVVVEKKWTGDTKRRFGTGTAYFVQTDQGEFGFFGTPFTTDSDEMFAELIPNQRAQVKVIDWLHGPLLAQMMQWSTRPLIVEVGQ